MPEIGIRFADEELNFVKQQAQKQGMSVAAFIKDSVLTKTLTIEMGKDMLGFLPALSQTGAQLAEELLDCLKKKIEDNPELEQKVENYRTQSADLFAQRVSELPTFNKPGRPATPKEEPKRY